MFLNAYTKIFFVCWHIRIITDLLEPSVVATYTLWKEHQTKFVSPAYTLFKNADIEFHCGFKLFSITVLHSHFQINEPVHELSNNVVNAISKASDHPAHTRSLIRAFACRLSIL